MDLKDSVRDIAKRASVARETAETEEATKQGVILPFIRALGFDIFDLSQVVPEFNSDVGTKKGEKVDYALKIDGEIVMLVEAKPVTIDLGEAQYNQLYRYFSVTDAQIAILTNGIEVWFFSDIDEKNRMDKRPFFRFSFEGYDEDDVKELAKFHRERFNIEVILRTAAALKYTTSAASYLKEQLSDPSDDFVRLVGKQIYDGNLTKSVIEQLREPVRSAFANVIREKIQEKLTAAFADSSEDVSEPEVADAPAADDGIVTTDEEIEAFYIVRSIVSKAVSPERVFMRDAKSYCSVIFDDNNRKPICRLRFNSKSVKYIGIFDSEKKEARHEIERPADIARFGEALIETVKRYE